MIFTEVEAGPGQTSVDGARVCLIEESSREEAVQRRVCSVLTCTRRWSSGMWLGPGEVDSGQYFFLETSDEDSSRLTRALSMVDGVWG